jgi:hypothetical protein
MSTNFERDMVKNPYKVEFCRLAICRLVPWVEAHGTWAPPTKNLPGHFALETHGCMCIYIPEDPLNPWEVRSRALLDLWVHAPVPLGTVLSARWDPLEVVHLDGGSG